MNCPTCTANVPDDSAFCPQCGGRLRGAAADKAPAVQPTTAAATSVRGAAAAGLKPRPAEAAENELWTGGYSPKAMYGGWIAAALATIAGLIAVILLPSQGPIRWWIFGIGTLVIWGGLLVTLAYRRMSVKYRLTNQRLFHEKGILRRVTERIELIDIDDVTMEQGLMERLFGVGTVHVTSSDRSSPELLMPGIDDVKAVADTIDHARRAERHRRGVFIESV
ncbi:MAG TPA: PH domain-containing protein [Pirellulales bacterium]|jgi:membrane protein YdbS with pleckstrin-like domain|nr:PH domain-containing protein [Pirellulales bacterium]